MPANKNLITKGWGRIKLKIMKQVTILLTTILPPFWLNGTDMDKGGGPELYSRGEILEALSFI